METGTAVSPVWMTGLPSAQPRTCRAWEWAFHASGSSHAVDPAHVCPQKISGHGNDNGDILNILLQSAWLKSVAHRLTCRAG